MKNSQVVHHSKVAFRLLCESVSSYYSDQALALITESDKAFSSLKMPEPDLYGDATIFKKDYQIYNYLRKYKGLSNGIDLKEVALSKWKTAEEQCSKTNLSLTDGSYLGYDVETAFLQARRKIARVLGDFSFDKVLRHRGMGPGATFDVSRRARPGTKYSLPISVTESCLPFARFYLAGDKHFAFSDVRDTIPDGPFCLLDNCFKVVRGNRMSLVPKDASTDRVISIEPTFNLFLQKGVGGYIRSRLKRFGIDLDSQSRNQDLARSAQSLGLATLDLSSASDSICTMLVKLLLPPDWYDYLEKIRSVETLHQKKWYKLEKFSSMGNGFTFELETLLFWALAPSSSSVISVYGDDLICSQDSADEYISILNGCGFTINEAKSFKAGRFFESCGKHFFDGEDVTPCYQKEIVSTASSYVRAYNRLFKAADRLRLPVLEDVGRKAFFDTYPYSKKPYVPYHADDRGFLTYDYSSFKHCPNRGYKFPVLKTPKLKLRCHQGGLYAKKLMEPSLIFGADGRTMMINGMERNERLSYSWIQPFPFGEVVLPWM